MYLRYNMHIAYATLLQFQAKSEKSHIRTCRGVGGSVRVGGKF